MKYSILKWRVISSAMIFTLLIFCGTIKCMNEKEIIDESWGFYKPHLLLSLTQRSMNPMNFGLIYSNERNRDIRNSLRWSFQNTRDGINAFYSAHNGNDYAAHSIIDKKQQISYQSTYIRPKQNAKSWQMKLTIENLDPTQIGITNTYLYFTSTTFEENRHSSKFNLRFLPAEAPFKVQLAAAAAVSQNVNLKQLHTHEFRIKEEESPFSQSEPSLFEGILLDANPGTSWDMEKILFYEINGSGSFNNNPDFTSESNEGSPKSEKGNNIGIIRVSNPWRSSISLLIEFVDSQEQQQYSSLFECGGTQENQQVIQQSCFDSLASSRNEQFQEKIREIFGVQQANFIKNVLSNLLGGFVFYHGKIVTRNSLIQQNPARTVFSASPSRKTFPRAFLWDEGFHLSVICKWDESLCRNSLSSWMNQQDVLGYIPREQVRTDEISRLVPDGFRSQDANEANPPTLLLPILELMMKTHTPENKAFISNSFRRLEKWFKWFKSTQSHSENMKSAAFIGANSEMSYRWKCKHNECKQGNFLGSGLDDYPREDKGTQLLQHLDLQCWLVFFADTLKQISERVSPNKVNKYAKVASELMKQLEADFIDANDHLFKDIVSRSGKEEFHLTHTGYITLFPLFVHAVSADSVEFEAMLDALSDPNRLWSEFGIRSLSRDDAFYGTGDNYWRGPIWMPLNYLILRSLRIYYFNHERARIVYASLRENLIRNVVTNWENSQGQIFETYHPETGNGQRAFPFNGWTSLIILIISEKY